MIWDLHVHIAGVGSQGSGHFLAPAFRRSLACQLFMRRVGLPSGMMNEPDCDQQIARFIVDQLNASEVDRAVVLAFDAAYRDDGTRDQDHTLMVADNDFVADLASAQPKVLFGASIHPYRRDALAELERLFERGACLVKWLPGAQNIRADDPRCLPFYDLLARHRIPLLCHTGAEISLKAFPNTLNDPRRLAPALERGVTVVAAHCAMSPFLHQRSYFGAWREMALRYERFYGDISALGVITSIWRLRSILSKPELTAKLVYGSDFPVAPWPLTCVGAIPFGRAWRLWRVRNVFDQAHQLMQAAGVPREVFSRAERLLHIPASKKAALAAITGRAAA